MHYNESQHKYVEVEEHDRMNNDRMDEILDAIRPRFQLEHEDMPRSDVQSSATLSKF
jgi:hypothetical protein